MYPKLHHLINDLFGTSINLPIQSYGFFVAIAFLVAGYLLYYELKRKEKIGLLHSRKKTVIKGKPASTSDLLISGIIGFFIGLKLVGIFFDYSFFARNPQEYVFSWEGSYIGGIIIGIGSAVYTWWNKERLKLPEPKEVEVTIHPYQLTGSIILVAAISGIIGAKIFHQLEYWDDFMADPWGSLLSFSGLTFYGGLIVATFAVVYYANKNKISWMHLGDSVAPSLMIAYGLGRIGCQVSGDGDWGIVNTAAKPDWLSWLPDGLWAFKYPHNVLNQGVEIPNCDPSFWGQYCNELAQPVFPTPVYETTVCLLFFLLLWLIRKRLKVPGMLFAIYLILNGIERFFIEKIRVNSEYFIFGLKITQAEIISFFLILLGILGIWYFRKRYFKMKLQKSKE